MYTHTTITTSKIYETPLVWFRHSLWFYHHSAGDYETPIRPVVVPLISCQARTSTSVKPPASGFALGTVSFSPSIIVLVVGGEFHPVVIVLAKLAVTIRVSSILQRVAGVSAVSRHFQSIFVVELVTDLERPVLGRVPEICWIFLHLHSQTVRLWTGQKVDILKTEPKVGISGSKPSFVVSPRQFPVESGNDVLMNDDPTKHGLDRYSSWLGRYCYVNALDRCNETCKICVLWYDIYVVRVYKNITRYYVVSLCFNSLTVLTTLSHYNK